MTAVLGPVDLHMEALRRVVPGASSTMLADHTVLITLPDVPLPPGWNRDFTTVWFVAPVGYPGARPDCFWTLAELGLQDGRPPQNSNVQPAPWADATRWFSWHLQTWNPAGDSLVTFLRVIQDRFRQLQ